MAIGSHERFIRRKNRTRRKIKTCSKKGIRLLVVKSNVHTYAYIIDDIQNQVLVKASSQELTNSKGTGCELAKEVGKLISQRGREKGILEVAFDRGGYAYHGRVAALAEGSRDDGSGSGLRF